MELEMAKYNSYSNTIIWSLICSGLWPKGHYVLKKILSFISFFSITTIMTTAINFSFHNARNVQLMTKGMGTAVSFSSVFSKVIQYVIAVNYFYTFWRKNGENRTDLCAVGLLERNKTMLWNNYSAYVLLYIECINTELTPLVAFVF